MFKQIAFVALFQISHQPCQQKQEVQSLELVPYRGGLSSGSQEKQPLEPSNIFETVSSGPSPKKRRIAEPLQVVAGSEVPDTKLCDCLV